MLQNFTATPLPLQITSVAQTFGTIGVPYSQQLIRHLRTTTLQLVVAIRFIALGTDAGNQRFDFRDADDQRDHQFTVKVTDALSATATKELTLTVSGPPIVALQPTNSLVTVTVGSNVTFSVSVAGTGPLVTNGN